jgi:alpha/beta superfamily hydrolase
MHEQNLTITGPAGGLESLLVQPDGWREHDPIAICCHPHPLHGGSMHNKVVYIMAKTYHQLGCATLRFNFRGVGQSQGEFDNGVGEQADALAVAAWLRQQYPEAPLWLGGFSFGGYVSLMSHAQINPARLLVVAPAVELYPDVQDVQVQTKDWILVQGGQDDLVSPVAVGNWLKQQQNKPRLIWLEQAGHLFHGHLNQIQEQILAIWTRTE